MSPQIINGYLNKERNFPLIIVGNIIETEFVHKLLYLAIVFMVFGVLVGKSAEPA